MTYLPSKLLISRNY